MPETETAGAETDTRNGVEEEDGRRSMDDIPFEEILNALREVLKEQASMAAPALPEPECPGECFRT